MMLYLVLGVALFFSGLSLQQQKEVQVTKVVVTPKEVLLKQLPLPKTVSQRLFQKKTQRLASQQLDGVELMNLGENADV